MEKGLIHIYCGDGKGKTTAALGQIIRAAGHKFNIILVQFMKSWNSGEIRILQSLDNIRIIRSDIPTGFSWELNNEQRELLFNENNRIFKEAIKELDENTKMLIVFDELIGTYDNNLIDKQMVLGFLRNKPESLEIVMTGRNPGNELIELADYVSKIDKVKHPYDKGIKARQGIEF